MVLSLEDRDILEESRRANEKIFEYCEERGLAAEYFGAWPAGAIGCGRTPLPLIILALIEDNQRLRDDLQQFKMDMGT